MSDRFTIALNLANKAPSQYLDAPFDSVVEWGGKLVFFGESGIFEEGGSTDDGTAISAWVDTPLHDFGSRGQKEIAAYDIGYEAGGSVKITLYADEDVTNARSFTHAAVKSGQVQQDGMKTLTRYAYGKGRYWKVRLENVAGCDCSFDYLALAPIFLKRRGY